MSGETTVFTPARTDAVFAHLPARPGEAPPFAWDRLARAFAQEDGSAPLWIHALTQSHFDDARARWAAEDGAPPCAWVSPGALGGGDAPPVLAMPGVPLAPFAWRRRGAGRARAYSLVGVIDAFTQATVLDDLAQVSVAPVEPWDAVVCSSRAVEAAVRRQLEEYGEWLVARVGAGTGVRHAPTLRAIPTGVACDRFAETAETREIRGRVRRGLGIDGNDVAVLLYGRFGYRDRFHPLALYRAADEAARRSGKRLFLIHAGRFSAPAVERDFRDAARAFAPNARCIFLDGDDPAVRGNVWFAADVFVQPTDNVRDSSDAAILSAMAAGLPVVAADFGAARDRIGHGVEGILVPAWLPEPGQGADLALAPELALMPEAREQAFAAQCATASQATAVDVAALTDGLAALVVDEDRRRAMGAAARRRAREGFDWTRVIAQHRALWAELADRRVEPPTRLSVHAVDEPAGAGYGDPFVLFAGHGSRHIGAATRVALSPGADAARLKALLAFPMNAFAADALPAPDELELMLIRLAEIGGATAADLAHALPPDRQGLAARGIGWLAKMGLVALASDEAPAAEIPVAVGQLPEERLATPGPEGETQRLVAEAHAAERRGDVNAAAVLLRDILAGAPDHAEANLRLGEILAGAGDVDGALDHFRRAVVAAPAAVATYCALGRGLMLKGDADEAVAAFRRAVEIAPQAYEPLFLLGTALRRAGGVFEAVQTLRAGAAVFPDRSDIHYQFGLALKAQGRRAEALDAFHKGLALAPNDIFLRAAADSLKTDMAGPGDGAGHAPRTRHGGRVALFFSRPQHYPVLRPLFERLAERHWPLISGDWREIADFAPDMVVACEPFPRDIRRLVPGAAAIFMQTSFLSASAQGRAAAGADIVVAIGPEDRERFAQAGLPDERIWTVGAPSLDPLARAAGPRPTFLGQGSARTILFAPTFHPALSAAPMLGARAVELLRGGRRDVKIVIKPHPVTCLHQPHWLSWWRPATADETVRLVDDPAADIVPLLVAADVLVTDCSNVMFQFLLADRPMVLMDNPDRFGAREVFDPTAPEWTFRSIGERVERVDDLTGAVFRAMAAPEAAKPARAECRRRLYGEFADDRALERLLERIGQALG